MKKTVSPPEAPAIKVFIMALLKKTDCPLATPKLDPPLKKHQQTQSDRVAKAIYVGLFGSKCSE